jgi:hypothetical protein
VHEEDIVERRAEDRVGVVVSGVQPHADPQRQCSARSSTHGHQRPPRAREPRRRAKGCALYGEGCSECIRAQLPGSDAEPAFGRPVVRSQKRLLFIYKFDPADTDFQRPDGYVKNLLTGDLTLASVSATGVEVGGELAALCANGQRLLLNGVSGGINVVYVKNLKTGTLRLISTSDTEVKADAASLGVSLADGKASFYSDAFNLDPADTTEDVDVYVKDLATGDLSLVSTTLIPPDARPFDEYGGAMSEGGTKVVFESYANVTPSDVDKNRLARRNGQPR